MCKWLLQIMDLPDDVGRLHYKKWGRATGSLNACLCKGQPYYVDIERAVA